MSQFNENYVILVERNETYPLNFAAINSISIKEIEEAIKDITIYKKYEDIKEKYPEISETNFKNGIPEKCILINEDAEAYFMANNWYSTYQTIITQTILPLKYDTYNVLQYIYLNIPNESIPECNHFITALMIDLSYVNSSFYSNFNYYFPQEIVALNPIRFHKKSLANIISANPIHKKEIENNNNFIKLLLTYAQFHFDSMNYLYYPEIDNRPIISGIIATSIRSDAKIHQPIELNTILFPHQMKDIFWMGEIEFKKTKFVFDDIKVISFGNNHEITFREIDDDVLGIPDYELRAKLEHNTSKLNYYIGGCLSSAPGLGKTLTILTFCIKSKGTSIIIVPPHLIAHWVSEYEMHIKPGCKKFIIYSDATFIDIYSKLIVEPDFDNSIILINYIDAANMSINYVIERVIIDEFHELYQNGNIFPSKIVAQAKFHWAITATPFITSEMCYNILNYVIKRPFKNPDIIKYTMYANKIASLFRMSTAEDFNKCINVEYSEEVILLELSEREKIMLESLTTSSFYLARKEYEERLLAFCIYPNFFSNNRSDSPLLDCCFSDKDFIDILMHDSYVLTQKLRENMEQLLVDTAIYCKSDLVSFSQDELFALMQKEKIADTADITLIQKNLVELNKHIIFVTEQLRSIAVRGYINSSTAIFDKPKSTEEITMESNVELSMREEDIICGICYDKLNKDFTMLSCGHLYCTSCIKKLIDHGFKSCTICKKLLNNTKCYTIPNCSGQNNKLIELYGTKISYLIDLCKRKTGEKIIIYIQKEHLIQELCRIINYNDISAGIAGISTGIGKPTADLYNFIYGSLQVLILSAENNASGLCLQCAQTIILLQPIVGEYSYIQQTEKQIIGRCLRIGQKTPVKIYRIIIANSIEDELVKYNRVQEILYQSRRN